MITLIGMRAASLKGTLKSKYIMYGLLASMARMDGSLELLRERAKATADVDVDHLVERLNLAPFRV